ncbi:MAG: hotdog fold thioesterase [Coriobacteriia bacterium]|nr:hotdog fold thioesterase [Coriobacteriia bacterium]
MSLADMLNLEIVESTPERYVTRMLVTKDMLQPHGVLHGGISAALAENAASEVNTDHCDPNEVHWLGVEVTSKHLLPVFEGDTVETVAEPLQLGGRIRQWEVKQYRLSDGKLFNVSQMIMYGQKQHH